MTEPGVTVPVPLSAEEEADFRGRGTLYVPELDRVWATLDAARSLGQREPEPGCDVHRGDPRVSGPFRCAACITAGQREPVGEALDPLLESLRALSDAATSGPWRQSWFEDHPRYDHMGEAWKDEKRREEGKLIRGGPRQNPVAMALQSEEDKALIVEAVNYLRAALRAAANPEREDGK